MIAIVDSGPLYATVDDDDTDHERSLEVFERADLTFVVPALVVTGVAYMVGRRLGPATEAKFIRTLADYEVESPSAEDWQSIANLVDRYADFPLGSVDASVVVLADRLGTNLIVSLDQRHFRALRRPDGRSYSLLPE